MSISNSEGAFNQVVTTVERLPNKRLMKVFSGIVKAITQVFYNTVSKMDRDHKVIFMNYGYQPSDPAYPPIQLTLEDENHRHQIYMYHYIASPINWEGLHALEVGSGRGGGAAHIKRHFQPKTMTGVDLSNEAVAFCKEYHAQVDGLHFVQGDAEALNFPNESFDIILNVESSLYYPNVEKFFAHVSRMLKPGGHFLYADMRYHDELEEWHQQLRAMGLETVHEEDITQNARKALAHNQEFRQSLVKKYVPPILQPIFARFGGLDGGRLGPNSQTPGKRVYKRFVFRKKPSND